MSIGTFSRGSQAAQRLLLRSAPLRRSATFGYGLGLLLFLAALVLRFWLDETLPPGFPFVTFFPAVIISAFLAGSRSAILCAVLSGLSAWYWFIGTPGSFSVSYGAIIALGFFAFIIAVDIAIIEAVSTALDRLTAQEAKLNTIVETVPLGLVMAEFPSGRIVGGNRYVEQMLRHPVLYSPDIHSYGEWVSFHEDGSRVDGHEYPLARMMLHGEENPSIDVLYQRGDGSKAWTRILGRPVRDDGGRITGGVVALMDIDEQHKSRVALEEALRSKDVLLYEVNHRVKNSLQLVNSILFLEASKIADEEARSAIMVARSKVELIARLHQRLYMDGAHDSVNLKTTLEELVRELLLAAGRSDVSSNVNYWGEPMISIRQASPLVLAVNEIITNSVKYGLNSERPELTVSASNANGELMLEIRDNGPGIAATRTQDKPGLGRQIAAGLVSQMRGKLVIHSDDSGTAIVMTLPATPKPANREEATAR